MLNTIAINMVQKRGLLKVSIFFAILTRESDKKESRVIFTHLHLHL